MYTAMLNIFYMLLIACFFFLGVDYYLLFNYECAKKTLRGAQSWKKKKSKRWEKVKIINKNQKLTSFFMTESSVSNSVSLIINGQNNNLNENDENNVVIIDEETITVINENIWSENQTGIEKVAIDVSSNTTSVKETILNKNQTINRNDPAEWKSNNYHREYIARNGYKQNKLWFFIIFYVIFSGNVNRYCSKIFVVKKLENNENGQRKWLVYSPKVGSLFCAPCTLFGSDIQLGSNEGFSNWKNTSERLTSHEQPREHKTSIISIMSHQKLTGRID